MKLPFATKPLRKAAALAAAALAVSATAAMAAPVMAYASCGHLTSASYNGDYDNADALIADAQKAGNATIDLYEDWTIGNYIYVAENCNVTINLNGHMLNRGVAGTKSGDTWWGCSNGQAIVCDYRASLTVNGGNKSVAHTGTLTDGGYFWKAGKGTAIIYGGLITGAAADGSGKDELKSASGAISCVYGSTITLNDVTMAGNVADNHNGSHGDGAALSIEGDESIVTANNCSFMYNHAEENGGAIDAWGKKMSFTGCTFERNYAASDGGAVYDSMSETVEFKDTTVSYNSAKGNGGGIWFDKSRGELRLDGVTVDHNYSSSDGGGIYQRINGSNLTLTNKTMVSNNSAKDDGGGVYLNDDCTFKVEGGSSVISNSAKNGGGVFIDDDGTTVSLDDASIASNTATAAGGGIYHNARNGKVVLSNRSMINENKVTNGNGGGVYDYYNGTQFALETGSAVFGNTASGNGGGLYLNDVATISLSGGSTIDYNQASNGGGVFVDDDTTTIDLKGGSAIANNTATYKGGGLVLADSTNLNMERSSIKDNVAGTDGGGIYIGYDGLGYAVNSTFNLTNGASISGNSAGGNGGGISSKVKATSSFFFDGGDFKLMSSDKSGVVENNSAGGDGGGAYMYNEDFNRVSGISFTGNTAKHGGGICYLSIGMGKLIDVQITGNSASEYAGGVCTLNDSGLVLGGKVVIDQNNVKTAKSNLEFCGRFADVSGDASCPLAKDSRVGVRVKDIKESQVVCVTDDNDIIKSIGDSYKDVFTSDDEFRRVVKQGGEICLERTPGEYALEITDAANNVVTKRVVTGDKVELKSADYAPSGYKVAYWTVQGLGDTYRLEPTDGVTSFTMPSNNVRVLVRCSEVLSDVSISLRDPATWDNLGKNPKRAYISAVTVDGTADTSCGITTSEDIRRYVLVTGGKAESDDTGRKTVTYTVRLGKIMLDDIGLLYSESAFKGAAANLSTSFASTQDAKVETSLNEDGDLILTVKATFDTPQDAVTLNAVNVNKLQADPFDSVTMQVSDLETSTESTTSGVKAMAGNERVAILAPAEPGWEFDSWQNLPSGASIDESTGVLTIRADEAANAKVTAAYKPLASAIAITVADLEVGKEFPTTIESCKVAGAAERDITSSVAGNVKIAWTKADGSPAGDTVEGDSIYEGNITTSGGGESDYIFGFSSSVRVTINGDPAAAAALDPDATTQTLSFYARTTADERYDSLVNELPTITVYDESQIEGSLPSEVYYKLKNGEILSAAVTWDAGAVTFEDDSEPIEVKGSFADNAGNVHEVTQKVRLGDLGTPEPEYETATDGSKDQALSFSAGLGWDGASSWQVRYLLIDMSNTDSIDLSDLDPDDFTDYTGPVTLKSKQFLLAYANVSFGSTVKQSMLGIFLRSLDVADVKLSSNKVAYGSAPKATVTFDGALFTKDDGCTVDYNAKAGVGKAYGLVYSTSYDVNGYKLFSYTVVPAKVKGIGAKAAGKKKVKVSWSKHKAQTSGFTVRYAASKAKLANNKGKAVKVKGAAKTSRVIKGLKSGKKYFFKVRAYKVVKGKTYYSSWSKVKAVKVK